MDILKGIIVVVSSIILGTILLYLFSTRSCTPPTSITTPSTLLQEIEPSCESVPGLCEALAGTEGDITSPEDGDYGVPSTQSQEIEPSCESVPGLCEALAGTEGSPNLEELESK